MTGQALRRADALLTELVELVETARAVPMSASCVIPREQVLDLLDELREVMPAEMDEARHVVAQRDAVLAEASLQAERVVELARHRAKTLVGGASARTAELVSSSAIHQSAAEEAARLRADAEAYVDQTLADLIAVLHRATATTEQGRQELIQRRERAEVEGPISGTAPG